MWPKKSTPTINVQILVSRGCTCLFSHSQVPTIKYQVVNYIFYMKPLISDILLLFSNGENAPPKDFFYQTNHRIAPLPASSFPSTTHSTPINTIQIKHTVSRQLLPHSPLCSFPKSFLCPLSYPYIGMDQRARPRSLSFHDLLLSLFDLHLSKAISPLLFFLRCREISFRGLWPREKITFFWIWAAFLDWLSILALICYNYFYNYFHYL